MKTTFVHEGYTGTVDSHGYVLWRGMGFPISAASNALKRAIAASYVAEYRADVAHYISGDKP